MLMRALIGFVAALTAQAAAAGLDQERAVALALAAQPQLAARAEATRALRESAVAAGELPDPNLSFGLQNVPTKRFDLTSEDMTQATVAIGQIFPGGAKRALNRERGERAAELALSELDLARRGIERDVRLAWLDLWLPSQSLAWLQRLDDAYQQQIEWGEVAYQAGKVSRDDILQWQAQRASVGDRVSEQRLARERARAQLRRWLGGAAAEEPTPELPAFAPGGERSARLERHPELQRAQRAQDVAQAEARLAKEAAKPDWNLNLAYGARGGGRSDLVLLQASVDLPIFPANRQDRRLAARLAEVNQAGEEREDKRRMLLADLDMALAERQAATERSERFEQGILPLQESRELAAVADYRAGKWEWSRVLDARRALLETRLQWLAQRAARARAEVSLRYLLGGPEAQP